MDRALLIAIACATFVPRSEAAPRVGRWGEDPSVVPSFAPTEERRAPKAPKADELWRSMQAPQRFDRVEGAMLVCDLQIGPPEDRIARGLRGIVTLGASELQRANPTVRLTVGTQPPIVLWGPMFHQHSFVSIPALTLGSGDRLSLAIGDRRLTGERSLGAAQLVWNGASPFVLQSVKWRATCVVVDAERASEAAQPWLASIDRQLEALARAEPARDQRDFGRPTEQSRQLRGNFKDLLTREGNFRYAAGFLGWGAPAIRDRIAKMEASEKRFDEAVTAEVSNLRESLPVAAAIELPEGSVRVLAHRSREVDLEASVAPGTSCSALAHALSELVLVDDKGHTSAGAPRLVRAAEKACVAATEPDAGPRVLRATFTSVTGRPLVLLRTAGPTFHRIDTVARDSGSRQPRQSPSFSP